MIEFGSADDLERIVSEIVGRAPGSRPTDPICPDRRALQVDSSVGSRSHRSRADRHPSRAGRAIGSRLVSVIPGRDVDLEHPRRSVRVDDGVHPGDVAQAQRRRRRAAPLRAGGRDLVGDPGRREVLGGSGRVAGGVVEDPALRARSRRAGAPRAACPPGRRRPPYPRPWLPRSAAPLNDRAAITAAARSASRSTKLTPSADPLREGFTTQGRPTRSMASPSAAPAPRSRSAQPSIDDPRGCGTPARASASLARTLSKATSQSNGAVPV